MEKILSAKNINKYFGENELKNHVLSDVSLEVYPRDFIAIMGPSGSGKSTLLYSISGMDEIDSGEIIFGGKNLTSLSEEELANIRRKEMGFVFQQATFLKNLSIIDNIVLPTHDDFKENKEDLFNAAESLMESVGIEDLKNRFITEVSGGQLQRAAICRAILHRPQILFADEPTGALNNKNSEEVLDLLVKLNEEVTIILVTHDPKVASRAKSVLFMKDGRIESNLNLEKEDSNKLKKVLQKMEELGI